MIKARKKIKDRIPEELISILPFVHDSHVMETKLDNLSLRAKVVIIDDIHEPKCDTFQNVVMPKMAEMSNVIFLCVISGKIPSSSYWPSFSLSRGNGRLENAFLGKISASC